MQEREQLSNDTAVLRDVYGPRWVIVPHAFGDRARQAREVLSRGLIPIDVDGSDPMRVIDEVGAFARLTSEMAGRVRHDSVAISEALAVDLCAIPIRHLRRACRALVSLAVAPSFPPAWASPAAARTASVVLGAVGEDLRALADLRRALYDEFTEDIWMVSARHRSARRELAAVTRSGRPAAHPRKSLAMLREARALNAAVDAAWTVATGHLGHFATSGIPDVDGANDALTAVRELHAALGKNLDVLALRALATADAFVADELRLPARAIVAAIDSWELRANRFGGFDPTRHTTEQLWRWSIDIEDSVTTLASLRDATEPLRKSVRTAGHILDDAIRRDRVRRVCDSSIFPAVSA